MKGSTAEICELAEALGKLGVLRDSGILTDQEFNEQKHRLLARLTSIFRATTRSEVISVAVTLHNVSQHSDGNHCRQGAGSAADSARPSMWPKSWAIAARLLRCGWRAIPSSRRLTGVRLTKRPDGSSSSRSGRSSAVRPIRDLAAYWPHVGRLGARRCRCQPGERQTIGHI